MDDKLLDAVISGNKEALTELLGSEGYCPQKAPKEEEIKIRVSEQDASFLLGAAADGNTALHIVASRGHLDLVEMICNKEISLLSARNMRLDTPLHCAASAGHHQMVSLLISFAREVGGDASVVLRAKNRNEETALHEVARNGDVKVVEVLVEEDAGLASIVNDASISPLYMFCFVERSRRGGAEEGAGGWCRSGEEEGAVQERRREGRGGDGEERRWGQRRRGGRKEGGKETDRGV